MVEAYRKMTNEILRAHEENVMAFLRADMRFGDCEERAEELGVRLSVSVHESYTAHMRSRYGRAEEDKFPYGYSSELEIDLVDAENGYILNTNPEDGRPVQMTLSYTIVRTPETMFVKKIELIPYDEIAEDGSLFAMLEEFLDNIEERGIGSHSPFCDDAKQKRRPTADLALYDGNDRLSDDSYVELQRGEFFGAFGRRDSLYLTPDAFFPYRLLLIHLMGNEFQRGGVTRLDADDLAFFIELLGELAEKTPGALLFSDLLSRLNIYEMTPPENAEKLLSAVTVARGASFVETTRALSEKLAKIAESHGAISVIDCN